MAQEAEFLELCKLARELEKRAMDILPTPISGDLAHEGSDIFPKEFEDYTYSYLLVEAHNIERKLFAATYTQQLSSQNSDSQMADELSNFASDGSYGQSRGKSGAPAKMPSVKTPSPMPPPPAVGQNSHSDEPLPPPSKSEIDIARETEAEGERRREEFFPPKPPQSESQAPPYKNEEEATGAMPPEAADEEKGEPPPLRQFADSSKISPRLRAIIEAKLRREEEREDKEGQLEKSRQAARQGPEGEEAGQTDGQQAKESIRLAPQKPHSRAKRPLEQTGEFPPDELPSESSGQPRQEAWGNASQEENEPPALSARERLLRSLQKETREARQKAHSHPPEMETPASPTIQSEQEEPAIANEEESASLEQEGEKAAEQKAIEQRGIEEKSIWEKTPREEGIPRASPYGASRPGSLLIRPVFPEEHSSSQPEEPSSQENERSAKIQKIIDELSFDRQKASAVSRQPQETQMEKEGPGSQEESGERSAQEPPLPRIAPGEEDESEEPAAQKTPRIEHVKAPAPSEDGEERRKDEIRKKMEAIFPL